MQERNHLMKNKTKFTFLTLALSMGLLIGACSSNQSSSTAPVNPSSEPVAISSNNEESSKPASSINTPSSSQQAPSSAVQPSSQAPSSAAPSSNVASKFTVIFAVDGKAVQITEVDAGETAAFTGETPTKEPDANAIKYRFKGWDKDVSQPITADTTFNAVFAEYAEEILVDDFENYSGASSLKDAGWAAWTLGSTSWTTETKASVSISANAADGKKALRLDAWVNNCDFKAVKTLQKGAFTKAANALQFKMMIPTSLTSVKVLLKGEVEIEGTKQSPSFSYILHQNSNEYVEYTIPLADDGWALWDDQTKSIKSVAGWTGVHEDDYLNYLTSIDFYARGDDGLGGQPYCAFIDSVKFVTLDNPVFSQTQKIKQYDRYTGTTSDGHTLRVDLAVDGGATLKVLDVETPKIINGNYVIENNEITITSSVDSDSLIYKGDITDAGKAIKFKSATGDFANAVMDMDLNAVQVVNNFEQYTENGVAYSQQNFDEDARSGVRGDFYSEYYTGSGNADWGGGGWQLMPKGDEINLKQDAENAHSGNNYLGLKHFSQNGARYMPWDLFKGQGDKNAFRGAKLSFWAKGYVNKLKVSMYSQSKPTNATRDQYVKFSSFNEGKMVDEWIHLEVELNPKLVYYGFMILVDNDYAGDGELLIDDIEVYTADPYATYVAPEVKKLTQGISYMGKINDLVAAQMFIRSDTQIYVSIPGFLSTVLKSTYTFDEKELVVTFNNGDVYTADVSEDMRTFTFKSISGTGDAALYLNNLSFQMMDYADDAETYDKDGVMYFQGNEDANKRSGARGAYYCEYTYSGGHTSVGGDGWILMGGNGDQLQLGTGGGLDGQKYLKMKKSTAGAMRYMQWGLFDGTAEAHTGVSTFAIYLSNPMASETKISLMVYKIQKVTTATDTAENKIVKDITLEANQEWTKYTIALDPTESYYGYAILAEKASVSAYFNVDLAYYYSVDNNPDIPYYAKKDMVLTGNITAGEASIKFDEGGKVYFTCAALGADNVEGSYDIEFVNFKDTVMTLTINGTTITCLYAVDNNFKSTLIVNEVSGTLASYIEVATIFSNQ